MLIVSAGCKLYVMCSNSYLVLLIEIIISLIMCSPSSNGNLITIHADWYRDLRYHYLKCKQYLFNILFISCTRYIFCFLDSYYIDVVERFSYSISYEYGLRL